MKTRLSIVALIVGLPGLWAHRGRASDAPYAPIDPQVTRLHAGGRWEHTGRSGQYRAIVRTRCSPEHCYDDLFIEWLARSESAETAGPRYDVAATRRIAQVGGLTKVSNLRIAPSRKETRLEVEHFSADEPTRWTICLTLGAPGNYTSVDGRCPRPK